MLASTAAALVGLWIAWYVYVRKPATAERAAASAPGLYYLSRNKLYVDEVYNLLFVQPLTLLAAIGRLLEGVVDDLARLIAMVPYYLGSGLRWVQNGLVQFYALVTVLGVALLIGWLVFAR
jgi:NADH-quinone oxidoreductase subunit L